MGSPRANFDFQIQSKGQRYRAPCLQMTSGFETSALHTSLMFALVYWIDEKLFSIVAADDVVLDKFNGVLKEGITCPVKWRERRSCKKVEERLYDAEIKAISGTLHPFL